MGLLLNEMPSYQTLAITSVCVTIVFIITRLVCGRSRKATPTTVPQRDVGNTSKAKTQGTGEVADLSDIPDSRATIQSPGNNLVRRGENSEISGAETGNTEASGPIGQSMGDTASTMQAAGKQSDGSSVDSVNGAEAPPSETNCADGTKAPPSGEASDAMSAELSPPGDIAASEVPPNVGIDSTETVSGVDTKATIVAPTTHIMRRNTEGSSRRNKPKVTDENDNSEEPKRHAGIFEYGENIGDGVSGKDDDNTESQECSNSPAGSEDSDSEVQEQFIERTTQLDNAQVIAPTRDESGLSKSPRTSTAAVPKTLIPGELGPLTMLTSTPVKYSQEITSPSEQTSTTDSQTQSGDTQAVNHQSQHSVTIDKVDVSSIVVCPQEFSEITGDKTAELSEARPTDMTDGESGPALDTFIVHSGVDSVTEQKEDAQLEQKDNGQPNQKDEVVELQQQSSDLNMEAIATDLKLDQTLAESRMHQSENEALRYKEYSRYLLQRYETEVRQRERAEDWCEFLTSELEAHINARILAETRYSKLLQRTKSICGQCQRLQKKCAALERRLDDADDVAQDAAPAEDAETTPATVIRVTNEEDQSLTKDSDLSPQKQLFTDLTDVRAAWQEQYDTAAKSDSEAGVLSFYDFSALSSSYDDNGHLLAEYDDHVAAAAADDDVAAAGTNEKKEPTEITAPPQVVISTPDDSITEEICVKSETTNVSVECPAQEVGACSEELYREQDSVAVQPEETDTVKAGDGASSTREEEEEEDRGSPSGQKIQIVVAPSIQDKAAMWEEVLSGRSQLRENQNASSADDSDHETDSLSASGGIRDARERLEEKLLGGKNDSSVSSLSSSRCDLSEQMLGNIQRTKMLWEDRASATPPLSTHSSRRHSFEDDDNNNNDDVIKSEDFTVTGNIQQTKLMWLERERMTPTAGSATHSHQSSRRMSLDGEDDLSSAISGIPEELTQTSDVSVQQSLLQWEEKMQAAHVPAASDRDNYDKGLCLYVEDELENDASNEHMSASVSSDSIGNVSHTKMMWEQVLREDEDEDDDDDEDEDEVPASHDRHSMKLTSPREKRFSALKKLWDQPNAED